MYVLQEPPSHRDPVTEDTVSGSREGALRTARGPVARAGLLGAGVPCPNGGGLGCLSFPAPPIRFLFQAARLLLLQSPPEARAPAGGGARQRGPPRWCEVAAPSEVIPRPRGQLRDTLGVSGDLYTCPHLSVDGPHFPARAPGMRVLAGPV